MAETGEYLTIAEVSALLGVHRNTVRNRVKAGRYKARKVVTPQGETYAIARDSLGDPSQAPTNSAAQPLTAPVRHNWSATDPQRGDLAGQEHAQADAVVQRLLAPFIAEQTRLAEELGQVKAERDELRRQLAEAKSAPPAAPQPASVEEARPASVTAPIAPVPAQGFWRRIMSKLVRD